MLMEDWTTARGRWMNRRVKLVKERVRQGIGRKCETGKLDLCDRQTNLLLAWLEKGLQGNQSIFPTEDNQAGRSGWPG